MAEINFVDAQDPAYNRSSMYVDPTGQSNRSPFPFYSGHDLLSLANIVPLASGSPHGKTMIVNKTANVNGASQNVFSGGEMATINAFLATYDALASIRKQSALLLVFVVSVDTYPVAGARYSEFSYGLGSSTGDFLLPSRWFCNPDMSVGFSEAAWLVDRARVTTLQRLFPGADGVMRMRLFAYCAFSNT